MRLCARLDSYISMLLKCNADATYLDAKTARDIHVDARTCERLATARERLHVLLWGDLVKITASWIRTLAKECEDGPANAAYDRMIAENTKLRCVLEAHHCLALRNVQVSDLDADRAKHLVVRSATSLPNPNRNPSPNPNPNPNPNQRNIPDDSVRIQRRQQRRSPPP